MTIDASVSTYLVDWLHLLLRWAHVLTGIAWIGSSFHFVALDNSLTPPADPDDAAKGVGGELWAVHGGGFYHQQKYPVAPRQLPDKLHWSMWPSYSTWLTGFALFTVLYLWQAGTYLVDTGVHAWAPALAGGAALGFLIVFWLVYDLICKSLGTRRHGDALVGLAVGAIVVVAAWLACDLYAGRAAFLLVGAMLATAMTANVAMYIIRGQRKVVASLRAGTPVDPALGARGKQRSLHNTYFTLPVLFAMLSNHFIIATAAPRNWLVLVVLMAAGALIRMSFVLRHAALAAGRPVRWRHAVFGCMLVAGVVWSLRPVRSEAPVAQVPGQVLFADVQDIVAARCVPCHNSQIYYKDVHLSAAADIVRNAARIHEQAVVLKAMPMNNATHITDAERATLARWFAQGAKAVP